MKLSVSNLAWHEEDEDEALEILRDAGIDGIEVAPTKINSDWNKLTPPTVEQYRNKLNDQGFEVSSLQALYFGKNDLALLKDNGSFQRLIDHTRRVAEIGCTLNGRVGVFGAPGIRDPDGLEAQVALDLALERFSVLGDAIQEFDFVLGIEPVPPEYGNKFLPSVIEISSFLEELAHPNIGLHLDTACVFVGGADLESTILSTAGEFCHFHIAERNLGTFDNPEIPHSKAARSLVKVGYDGWIAIEMNRKEMGDNWQLCLRKAVTYVTEVYFQAR